MDKPNFDEVQKSLEDLRLRIGSKESIKNEAVRLTADIMLRGQEAVNYQAAKIFCNSLSHNELIELIFKVGLKNATECVKIVAEHNGVKL